MTLVSIFELLAAISAVITVWVYGNKDNHAPIYGMILNYLNVVSIIIKLLHVSYVYCLYLFTYETIFTEI